MSEQKPCDQVNKAAYFLVEEIKNSVALNLTVAAKNNKIDTNGEAHKKLMVVVLASIDEGFHKGRRVFGKHVEEALAYTIPLVDVEPTKKNAT